MRHVGNKICNAKKVSFCLGGQSENVICWGVQVAKKMRWPYRNLSHKMACPIQMGMDLGSKAYDFDMFPGAWSTTSVEYQKWPIYFCITLRWLYYYTLIVSYCWLMCDVQQREVNALKHIEEARCVSSHVWPPCFIMPSYQVVFSCEAAVCANQ